jgi:hypothetical protein
MKALTSAFFAVCGKKCARLLLAAGIGILFLSCATNRAAYKDVDKGIDSGFYDEALAAIEKYRGRRRTPYSEKNAILLYLDKGMIEHYAGTWEASSGDLETGERLIEAAFTKSITQTIGSYIINDNVKEYAGEDYEDLYINVFNSLNYYNRGDLEGALVEIRRVNEKLLALQDKYEVARQKLKESTTNLDESLYAVEAVKFSNSALARYLGVLFYRANGDADDARIDLEELKRAYALAPEIYSNPVPSSLDEELAVPRDKARLNIISFTGLSPVKEEVVTQIPLPLPYPNNWSKLALPKMFYRPSAVQKIEVIVEPVSGGSIEKFDLELLENMGMVAEETFKAHNSLIVLKTVIRTILKSTTGAAGAIVVGLTADEQNAGGLGFLVGLVAKLFNDATEAADVRMARYFPGYAHVGAVNLDPGVYALRVNYYGTSGLLASEEREQVAVRRNTLNLMEFICLK